MSAKEIHNTHNISYSTVSDHDYKFDKDGNVIVDTLQDLIYDKGLTGEFGDKKKKLLKILGMLRRNANIKNYSKVLANNYFTRY